MTHSRKDFAVYEFDDEVEAQTELAAKRFVAKYSRKRKKSSREENSNSSSVRKHEVVKASSAGIESQVERMSSRSCIYDRASGCITTMKGSDAPTLDTFHMANRDCANKEGTSPEKIQVSSSISQLEDTQNSLDNSKEGTSWPKKIPESGSVSTPEDAQTSPDIVVRGNPFPECVTAGSFGTSCAIGSFGTPCRSESPCAMDASRCAVPSPGNEQINCNHLEKDLVAVISDDDGSPTCSSQGTLEGSTSDHCSGGSEMDDIHTAVVSPDYLIYKDVYSTDSLLCFSRSGIRIEGVDAYASKGSFSFEMDIGEVMDIVSQWWPSFGTVLVKVCVRSIVDMKTGVPIETSGTVELKFAVCDPCWLESLEEIMKVDSRYRAVWRVLLDIDANVEVDFFGKGQICYAGTYYPIFDVPFEDVIYPKGDPDAVSISKRDVELLEPETFINDTIVDFYIKYLKTNLKPEERNRFHFFNSFFFRKFADLDKNPSSNFDGRAAFMRVRKWTRRVNLFEKDYVFIPVNFSLHWSLIVICHPGEIAMFKDEEVDKSLKVPCILHMDSIKGSHKGLKDLVQSYLWEEWKERHQESLEEISSNFLNLRFVHLELPQQENSFDCGLFLLHYAERFLEEAPVCFNPFKLTKSSNFLNMDWFVPAEASLKRAFIQRLIKELLKDQSQGIPSAALNTECPTFQSMKDKCDKENDVEIHLEGTAANSRSDFSFSTSDDHGMGIKSMGNHVAFQSFEDSRSVLKEWFDQPMATTSLPNGQFRSLGQILSPIKEIEETEEQFGLSPGVAGYQPQTEYAVDDDCTSYSFKDFVLYNSNSKSGISVVPSEDDPDACSSSEAFSSSSQSSALLLGENHPANGLSPNREVTQMSQETSSGQCLLFTASPGSGFSEGLDVDVVEDSQEVEIEDSQEVEKVTDDNEKTNPSTCKRETQLGVNENPMGENPESSNTVTGLESDEQRASKRARAADGL